MCNECVYHRPWDRTPYTCPNCQEDWNFIAGTGGYWETLTETKEFNERYGQVPVPDYGR